MAAIRDVIVWDNSLRFAATTFIRMMARIMQMAGASGLPTIRKRQEF